ncbi:L-alanine exporter AlaE [Microbulbifer sp. OS29]|uniref:L-alanine exporter AlaE n=1 Tax=Microbulbifer okhotskensis TaxID=2926617 RepID=A0A9X2EMZ3_9GAMM|nr:L-alanine exporter AlaE [Microbulbifer okhotskensis]MCO1334706.1 L-alanine exporter AlaE [Microbulbifer okhotskensis]
MSAPALSPNCSDAETAKMSRARRWDFLLDIFAMNSFSWAVAIPIELFLAGMSWSEHLKVRLMALVFNTLIARPFSVYRNWIVNRFGGGGFINSYLVDTFVFLSFQFPLYMANMHLGGASWDEIATASITFMLIAGALGRPYGIYLDWVRRVWINTLVPLWSRPAD